MKPQETYTGPFPRGRHSHRCMGCANRGQIAAVACYKKHCTTPQRIEYCSWCRPALGGKHSELTESTTHHLDATANPNPTKGKITMETACLRNEPLVDWLRSAGRVTVVDEGLQGQLFGGAPVRMFRLYNGAGDSRQVDEDTARAYGLKPTSPKPTTKPQQSAGLFDTQEGLF